MERIHAYYKVIVIIIIIAAVVSVREFWTTTACCSHVEITLKSVQIRNILNKSTKNSQCRLAE